MRTSAYAEYLVRRDIILISSRSNLRHSQADNNVKDCEWWCQYAIRPEDSLADKALEGISRGSLGDLDPNEVERSTGKDWRT